MEEYKSSMNQIRPTLEHQKIFELIPLSKGGEDNIVTLLYRTTQAFSALLLYLSISTPK